MKIVKKLLKNAKINSETLFQVELEEQINNRTGSDTLFINILLNNKKILTSKPISMKLYSEILNCNFTDIKKVIYLLDVNNKFKKDDKNILNIINNLN